MEHHVLTLYGKKDCCLCDDAKNVLDRVHATVPFRLELVDIGSDPALTERYGTSIPVLCCDGVEVFRYRISEKKLIDILTRS
jgi:hypothetical protein